MNQLPQRLRTARGAFTRQSPVQRLGLAVEPLEQRQLLAGNVEVAVVGGNLVITGDTQDNIITVSQPFMSEPDEFQIKGLANTFINGTSQITVSGVTKDIRANMYGGDDSLSLSSVEARDLRVDGGDGNNSLTIGHSDLRNVRVLNGNGQDTTRFMYSNVAGYVSVRNGDGGSSTLVTFNVGDPPSPSTFGGSFAVTSGAGTDTVSIEIGTIDGPLRVRHGEGDSHTRLSGQINAAMSVVAQGGNDTIVIGGNHDGSLRCSTGTGTLDLDSYATFDGSFAVRNRGNTDVLIGNGDFSGSVNVNAMGGDLDLTVQNAMQHTVQIGRSFTSRTSGEFVAILEELNVDGRTSIRSGDGGDSVSIDNSRFQGAFNLNTGAGIDFVAVDFFQAGDPVEFFGATRIDLGSGNDWLFFGNAGGNSQSVQTYALVRLNGGTGGDGIDYLGHSNGYVAPNPRVVGFEGQI